MKLLAFTIYDNKALQYHPPFFAATDGAAVRSLSDLVNDNQNNIGRHPSDYSLFCCGEWDDNHGQFTAALPNRHVADAIGLLKPDNVLPFNFDKAAQ